MPVLNLMFGFVFPRKVQKHRQLLMAMYIHKLIDSVVLALVAGSKVIASHHSWGAAGIFAIFLVPPSYATNPTKPASKRSNRREEIRWPV